jgi:hypothetical protein
MPDRRDPCYDRAVTMPREVQSNKNKTGGIEHIQTSPLAFLPPSGICPRGMTAERGNDAPPPAHAGAFNSCL